MKKKITRMDLAGLRNHFELLSEEEQRMIIGCGTGTLNDPYTLDEFYAMMDDMNTPWSGGYVAGWGYVLPEAVCYYGGSSGYNYGFDIYSPYYNFDFGNMYFDIPYSNEIGSAANALSLPLAVKEGLFKLASSYDGFENSAKTYLNLTKFCRGVCSGLGIIISVTNLYKEQTTENYVKFSISLSALVLGPGGTVVYSIAEMSGGIDYLTEQLVNEIDKHINK